jgi:hypothetical protein
METGVVWIGDADGAEWLRSTRSLEVFFFFLRIFLKLSKNYSFSTLAEGFNIPLPASQYVSTKVILHS